MTPLTTNRAGKSFAGDCAVARKQVVDTRRMTITMKVTEDSSKSGICFVAPSLTGYVHNGEDDGDAHRVCVKLLDAFSGTLESDETGPVPLFPTDTASGWRCCGNPRKGAPLCRRRSWQPRRPNTPALPSPVISLTRRGQRGILC
ncbi:hypothetical protein Esi_0246_0033 [Ectocarpus siliculosus]|uniref:Uncharacterized protein n=1 Tax=Ectocarpus siliculosus TaxID=2880 RepID=D7FT90_ECTSI|nr:hypothetical protein Esi_0246_0033 [Ectocarpus siliculosus]|eukprot:CBJ31356.1 hypothetical protein Esi_0246_0033 [Ectocarpus siliculosus]